MGCSPLLAVTRRPDPIMPYLPVHPNQRRLSTAKNPLESEPVEMLPIASTENLTLRRRTLRSFSEWRGIISAAIEAHMSTIDTQEKIQAPEKLSGAELVVSKAEKKA